MFAGFAELDAAFDGLCLTRGSGDALVEPDDLPEFTVFGPAGVMPNGSGTCTQPEGETSVFFWAVTPAAADGYEVGRMYRVVLTYEVSDVSFGVEQTFIVT